MKRPEEEASREEEAIETAAVTWLCERDEGFTSAQAEAFAAWCAADPRHAAAVARVEHGLALLQDMPAVRVPLEARFGPPARAVAASESGRRGRFPLPLWAAGLAAVLVLGLLLGWPPPFAGGERQYATPSSATQRIELPDGSILTLNAASNARVGFTRKERQVRLTAGEAHFAVAHDPNRPFIVTAEGVSVRAVGTAFNVRVTSTEVEVLVVEGRVELAPEASPSSSSLPSPSARPLLAAGEQASVARQREAVFAPKIEKVQPEVVRATLAWHTRVMRFSDVPLREVVEQFNRRNAVRIVFADHELGERKVGGSFALDEVDAFVRLLALEGDIEVERRDTGEIVLRRAR